MKIALVTPEAHWHGGVPQYVSALAKALTTEHEVTIFSVVFNDLENTGIHHHPVWALGSDGFIRSLTFAVASSLLLLLSHLKRTKRFDIIHSHGDYAALADVVSSHYCEAVECERLRRQKQDVALGEKLKRWSMRLLEKFVVNRTRGKPFIVPSKQMKRDFVHHYSAPSDKTFVIHGGVDSERYSPCNVSLYREEIRHRHSLDVHTPMVLFVGGDWERKGLAQAIKAISYLAPLKPNLLVVSTGDVSLFKKMASDIGVAEQVLFVGRSQEVWKYFAACDVFLLPTLYEAFGLTVLEAMASGLPALVSDKAGAAELIQDGYNGLLLKDPTDASEIAAKLEGLFLNERFSKQLGAEARRTALQFSWESVAQRTVEVYKGIVG